MCRGSWGHKQQYEGFFICRWLSEIGGAKASGGWFDPYGTDPTIYLDQAYVTVLAGAPEILLFHYGSLISSEYRAHAEAVAAHRPELDVLAKLVGGWRGIPAYKPPSSDPGDEPYLFDQVGMLGIPPLPTARFPEGARVGLFTAHALEDKEFVSKLVRFLDEGGTALVSEGLAHRLHADPSLLASASIELAKGKYFEVFQAVKGRLAVFSDALPRLTAVDAENKIPQLTPEFREALQGLRGLVSEFMVTSLDAPPRVAVFPMGGRVAVANFTELPVDCRLTGFEGRARKYHEAFATSGASLASNGATLRLPPHGVLVIE